MPPGNLLIFILWRCFDFYLADSFLKYRIKILQVLTTLTWDFFYSQLLLGTKYSAIIGLRESHDEILIHDSQWMWQCLYSAVMPKLCSRASLECGSCLRAPQLCLCSYSCGEPACASGSSTLQSHFDVQF